MSPLLQRLRELPFPAQLAAIDAELAANRTEPLLRELCSYRDYQPLAYALASLAEAGALTNVDAALIDLLLDIPDTGLRRVLRALDGVKTPASFTKALADGAWQLSVERIAAVAMVDRWLKNTIPLDHRKRAVAGISFVESSIAEGSIEQLLDARLMRLPGTALAALDTQAQDAGCLPGWKARQNRFARKVLDVLESQPKSLSQTNAEELLSRQVYTDPGHFLVELLQNADDAGASFWRVQVFADRIEVEHNGTPFDALDVVGILSIGQTTKSKEQIGFFGVGFKSVYEICERPQLYSGVYNFEIADVSIPRPLLPLEGRASGNTRLVLPLRHGRDENVSPKRLFETLAELPSEVVLTLNSVRELDLRYQNHVRQVRGRDEPDGRFRIDDGDLSKRYLVERTEAHYEGARNTHKASSTPVLIAVPLDADGLPKPSQGAPTIYSYLPTHERSGLRLLVHAHFDLPVDRERIDLGSQWNQWALGQAGTLLASAVMRLCEEQSQGKAQANEVLDAVLRIVSLPGELNHQAFEAIGGALRTLKFLPGADGERQAATNALLCDDARIRDACATVVFAGGGRLLRKLGGRELEVARWLGATELETSAVVDEIARDATQRPAGNRYDAPWSPLLPDVIAALAEAPVPLGTLRALPCLPDSDGLAQAPNHLNRAASDLREFLIHVQPLVRKDLEHPNCSAFLDALGVNISRVRDLVALCSDDDDSGLLVDRVGAPALIHFLQAAPPIELEFVAFANIVPNDRQSLSAVGEVWVTGSGALAALIRSAKVRPQLVESDTEQLLGSSLRALGCRSLDVSALLDCIDDGTLAIEDASLCQLHHALNDAAHSITPRVAKRLAQTALFPVRDGGALPILGDVVASIPHDEELTELLPDRRWLAAEVACLPYVGSLGAHIVGPEDLAAYVLSQPESEARPAIFAYLASHSEALSATTTDAMARAAIWPDVHGMLRPIAALRRQAQRESVAALYAIWPRAITVEQGDSPGSVLHLASAIHVQHQIISPDLTTAIQDLRNISAMGSGPYRSDNALDLDDSNVASIVTTLLNDAASSLPRITLGDICEAPIFLCTDGERRRLGSASEPQASRALRVSGFLVPAFESLGFAILAPELRDVLEPLLDALLLRPATLIDLVRETRVGDRELNRETAQQFRKALCSDLASIATLDEAQKAEVSSLSMWPCHGGLFAAAQVVRGRAFDSLLADAGLGRSDFDATALSLLDDSAEHEAEILSTHLTFASPVKLLASTVQRIANVDEPLASQPPILSDPRQVGRLAAVLAKHYPDPWSLPVSVNAAGRLVARPLLLATGDEYLACAGLNLYDELAHAGWSDVIAEADWVRLQTLGMRRLIDAMREVSGEAVAPQLHQSLASAEARGAFYRWLLMHADEISLDEQSLGLLGNSAVILSQGETLRHPRELLFDRSLPDLGIDWNPSKEISERLGNWLRSCYRPASKQLRPIVDHLVEAIDDAADAGDGERIAAVLEHLASVLRAGYATDELEELAKRFKLRKRLRVETGDGQFAYARRLLAAEPLDADLVPRFALSPPSSAAHRYRQPKILRLLRAAGAADELSVAALRGYLGGEARCPGSDSDVAFACYLASAAQRQPSLRNDLDLRRLPWLPDSLGNLHQAESIYWPTPELATLIGRDARLYVHPEFVLRVPEAGTWLPLRTAKDVALRDIAAHLRATAARGEPASADALAWLDTQVAENHLTKDDLCPALGDIPMLVDDHGQMRCSSELIVAGGNRLFGERRGTWSAGTRLRHLAAALGISRRPQVKDIVAFFVQIHQEFVAHPEVLQQDTAVLEVLPRCLDALIELGGRGPQQLPVAAMQEGQLCLILLPAPGATVGLPQQMDDADLVLRLADGADVVVWTRFLRSYGVGPVEEEVVVADVQAPARSLEAKDTPTAFEEEEPDGPGVISRLRSWFRGGDDDDEEHVSPAGNAPWDTSRPPPHGGNATGSESAASGPSDPEPPPYRPIDQRAWFRGDNSLSTQLASNPSWLADRMQAAEFGLAHAPLQLPVPHRYAPSIIFADFDKRRQQWKPLRAKASWREGGAPVGRLHLRGKLPSPEARIPMPLYGHLTGISTSGKARVIQGRDAVALLSKNDPEVSFTIELAESPNFSGATKGRSQKDMLAPCVADSELPEEVLDLVESLSREDSAFEIAGVVRSFVRKRYVYDPSYLEDPQMAAWLQERSAGRSNVHIAALHAGGDARYLGRGVCYELNTLVCEMLRRAGVQAAVATGWTFDRGHIDEPDHLWAMALVETSNGPRWFPVDASTTQSGRPLHAAHRPPGPWRADKRKARPIQEPQWTTVGHEQREVESLPLGDLLRVARYLENVSGQHLGTRGEILAACRDMLSSPERRAAFADLLGLGGEDKE